MRGYELVSGIALGAAIAIGAEAVAMEVSAQQVPGIAVPGGVENCDLTQLQATYISDANMAVTAEFPACFRDLVHISTIQAK